MHASECFRLCSQFSVLKFDNSKLNSTFSSSQYRIRTVSVLLRKATMKRQLQKAETDVPGEASLVAKVDLPLHRLGCIQTAALTEIMKQEQFADSKLSIPLIECKPEVHAFLEG